MLSCGPGDSGSKVLVMVWEEIMWKVNYLFLIRKRGGVVFKYHNLQVTYSKKIPKKLIYCFRRQEISKKPHGASLLFSSTT